MRNLVLISGAWLLASAESPRAWTVTTPAPAKIRAAAPAFAALRQNPALRERLDLHRGLSSPRLGAGLAPLSKAAARDTFMATQFNVDRWTGTQWGDSLATFYNVNNGGQVIGIKDQYRSGSLWMNADTATLTYDGQGRILTTLWQYWDSAGTLQDDVQLISAYSGDSLEDFLFQAWDNLLGGFGNVGQDSIRYDANGDIASETLRNWISGSWVNFLHISNTYQGKGLPILNLYEVWIASLRSWAPDSKDTTVYDSLDRPIRQSSLYMDGLGNWANATNTLSSYGSPAKPTQIVYQYWDGVGWADDFRETYGYTSQGFDSSFLGQYWDMGLSQWANDSRGLATADSVGNVTEQVYMNWNTGGGAWENALRNRWVFGRFTVGGSAIRPILSGRSGNARAQKLGAVFHFSGLEGVGRIEIRDLAGREVASLPVQGGTAAWRVTRKNTAGLIAVLVGKQPRRALRLNP